MRILAVLLTGAAAALIGAGAASVPAAGQSPFKSQSKQQNQPQERQVWRLEETRKPSGALEGCLIERIYPDGARIVFAQASDGGLALLFNRAALTPPQGWRGGVRMAVDDGIEFVVDAETAGYDVALYLTGVPAIGSLLSGGRWLSLIDLAENDYAIDGLGAALISLSNCVKKDAAAPPAKLPPTPQPAASPPLQDGPDQWVADMDQYVAKEPAEEDWRALRRTFAAELNGREPTYAVRIRETDGRRFYVMRFVGFADKAAADAFCAPIRARKRNCNARRILANSD